MFAVGVDVANGRSMVAVLDGMRNMVAKPFEVAHTAQGFAALVENCANWTAKSASSWSTRAAIMNRLP